MDYSDVAKKYVKKANDIRYPERPDRPARHEGESNLNYGARLDEFENVVMPAFRAARAAYHKAQTDIVAEFKTALFKLYGVSDNPKAQKVWEYAWQEGHSEGFSLIAIIFDDLVELIK